MLTHCPILCVINSSHQIELVPNHALLTAPRPSELVFELDTDNDRSVSFEIADFVHAGNSYSVAITGVRNDSTTHVWTRNGGISVSLTETAAAEIDIQVTATTPNGSPVTGGGIIRIQPKGKPD